MSVFPNQQSKEAIYSLFSEIPSNKGMLLQDFLQEQIFDVNWRVRRFNSDKEDSLNVLWVDVQQSLFHFLLDNCIYDKRGNGVLDMLRDKEFYSEDDAIYEFMNMFWHPDNDYEEPFNTTLKQTFLTENIEGVSLSQDIKFNLFRNNKGMHKVILQLCFNESNDRLKHYGKSMVFDIHGCMDFLERLKKTNFVYNNYAKESYETGSVYHLPVVVKEKDKYKTINGKDVIKEDNDYVLNGNFLMCPNGYVIDGYEF